MALGCALPADTSDKALDVIIEGVCPPLEQDINSEYRPRFLASLQTSVACLSGATRWSSMARPEDDLAELLFDWVEVPAYVRYLLVTLGQITNTSTARLVL